MPRRARPPAYAIDIAGQDLAGAREVMRVFLPGEAGGRVNGIIIDPPAGLEPFGFGILLADLVHHAAKAYAHAFGLDERDALYAISDGLSAELASPTDTAEAAEPEPH